MSSDFDQLMADIEAEAVAEGPEAVAHLREIDERYRLASAFLGARLEANLTQKALAKLSGVQQAEISRIECGQVVPTLATMTRLLEPLGRRIEFVQSDKAAA